MKKNYFLITILIGAAGLIATQNSGVQSVEKYLAKNGHMANASGAPTGRTGAPGESNCTVSCHIGTVQDGTAQNLLTLKLSGNPVSVWVPGQTYEVSLALATGDVKEGFEATVLDVATNSMAGNFPGTGGLGTAITTGGSRKYANHTSSSNLEGNVEWVWNWTAPATDVGQVKFYVASNKANGNGTTSGDAIYLSQHTFNSSLGINEGEEENVVFNAGYSSHNNKLILSYNAFTAEQTFMNLVDLNGKSVFTYAMGESIIGANTDEIVLPVSIESGVYIVNFFVGNNAMSSKIHIQK